MRDLKNALPLLAVLVLLSPAVADAQWLDPPTPAIPTYEVAAVAFPPHAVASGYVVTSPVVFGDVLRGSASGGLIGAAVGAGVGYLLVTASGATDEYFGGIFETGMGAMAGIAVGTYMGSRRASGERGDPFATGAGSLLGVVGGMGLGTLAGVATGEWLVGLAIALPVAIYLPAIAETATAR